MISTAFEPPRARRKKKPSESSPLTMQNNQNIFQGARRTVPGSGSSRGSDSVSESAANSRIISHSRSSGPSRAASVPSTISTQSSPIHTDAHRRSFSSTGSISAPNKGQRGPFSSLPLRRKSSNRSEKEEEARRELEQIIHDQEALTAVCAWIIEE